MRGGNAMTNALREPVSIVLTTYNGANYLDEQLQSLIAQTYKNIDVWIRDDGSSDATLDIVRRYCGQEFDGIAFHLVEDDLGNLGSGHSFRQILFTIPQASYYAFCDQDDVWEPQKVERAVATIAELGQDEPALYAANYAVCDGELNRIGHGRTCVPIEQMNVGRCFFNYGAGLGQGFTLLFNHALKEIAFPPGYGERGPDTWLWAVTAGLGANYVYDDYESAKYRRHDATITATGKGKLALWKTRLRQFREGTFFVRTAKAADFYRQLYYDQMTKPEDRLFLDVFGHYSEFGKRRLRKARYPYRLKLTVAEEIATRLAFICGKY